MFSRSWVASSLVNRPGIFGGVVSGRTPRSLMLFKRAVDGAWSGCSDACGPGAGDAPVPSAVRVVVRVRQADAGVAVGSGLLPGCRWRAGERAGGMDRSGGA